MTAEAPHGGDRGALLSAVMLGVACGAILVPLNTTMLAVALPGIMGEFGLSASEVASVVTLYLGAVAVALPVGGSLGDRFGHRTTFLAGVLGFGAASLLAALAPTFTVLEIARVLQAVSGAFVSTSSTAIVREIAPPDRRGEAFGLFDLLTSVSATVGPFVGGVLVAAFGWRSMFSLAVPIALIAAASVALLLAPGRLRDARAAARPLDVRGLVVLGLAIAGVPRRPAGRGDRGRPRGHARDGRPRGRVHRPRAANRAARDRPAPVPFAGLLGGCRRHLRQHGRAARHLPDGAAARRKPARRERDRERRRPARDRGRQRARRAVRRAGLRPRRPAASGGRRLAHHGDRRGPDGHRHGHLDGCRGRDVPGARHRPAGGRRPRDGPRGLAPARRGPGVGRRRPRRDGDRDLLHGPLPGRPRRREPRRSRPRCVGHGVGDDRRVHDPHDRQRGGRGRLPRAAGPPRSRVRPYRPSPAPRPTARAAWRGRSR